MPSMYTQGVMTGEGVAGVAVSLNRIITKGSYAQTDQGLDSSAFSFFLKQQITPNRRTDDGWRAVKYEGK